VEFQFKKKKKERKTSPFWNFFSFFFFTIAQVNVPIVLRTTRQAVFLGKETGSVPILANSFGEIYSRCFYILGVITARLPYIEKEIWKYLCTPDTRHLDWTKLLQLAPACPHQLVLGTPLGEDRNFHDGIRSSLSSCQKHFHPVATQRSEHLHIFL
jgi:hypothetical protein